MNNEPRPPKASLFEAVTFFAAAAALTIAAVSLPVAMVLGYHQIGLYLARLLTQ